MNHLVNSLLEKQALSVDTVFTVKIKENGGSKQDQFRMISVEKMGTSYRFKLRALIGDGTITAWAQDVIALDGMDPVRYVDVYDINPDGTCKKLGKKRGRKPKSLF